MIKLNPNTFRRAFLKAKEVQPRVHVISENEFHVARADGCFTRVVFLLHGGALWAQCDCPAGSPHGWGQAPLPCYHVAAALLNDGSAPAISTQVSRTGH